jgi:hypothetical protein
MVVNMRKKRRPIPGVVVPPLRTVQIGFRICPADSRLLSQLARDAGVGHLTLARLVLEKYLADVRGKGAGGKKDKGVGR